ncbi:hypothetical protein [Streptomyces sp. NPDC059881]|uniref:hypothetical protein n=1 Tax=Streptomyces sp. NPDC059881 TaxID=3346986 RepID=UPI00365378DC
MLNGLDDRRLAQGVLARAEELMADAVRAECTFFSTCGSSLSVKTAMITVAGPGQKLLVSRSTHQSVVAALIISGIHPVWIHPRFDTERHLAHPPRARNRTARVGQASGRQRNAACHSDRLGHLRRH